MMLNKNLQEINIQNMDTELVAQMFKNYQSNVLFHLEGMMNGYNWTRQTADYGSNERSQRSGLAVWVASRLFKKSICLHVNG